MIQKQINSKLDSINNKEYKITIEKIDISNLENSVNSLQKDIKKKFHRE